MGNPDILSKQALLKNEWMLKGFSQFKFDAVNLTYRDLRYSALMLEKDKYEQRLKDWPIMNELISANMIAAKDLDATVGPKPYVIREVTGKRFANGKSSIKVGFIGLTMAGPGGKSGLIVEDPLVKIKKILPEVRPQVDLLVVLAYVPLDAAKEMAKENPEIDVIIGASGIAMPPPGEREGKTVIVYAMNQTKSLGELRLYLDGDGKVNDYLNRYISLDSSIPDDPEAAKVNATAKAEIDALNPHAEGDGHDHSAGEPQNLLQNALPQSPVFNKKAQP